MAVPGFKIVDRHVVSSIDPARFGRRDQVIAYQTDAAHTYTIRIPAEITDSGKIAELIRADLSARSELAGKTFPI